MGDPRTIDVLVLANSADRPRRELTQRCLETLRDQQTRHALHILLAESCDAADPQALYGPLFTAAGDRRTFRSFRSPKPFNFNLTVQAALAEMDRRSHGEPRRADDVVLVSNNDVTYAPDCLDRLATALEAVDSVSPWMPGYHDEYHGPRAAARELLLGHRVREYVAGWSYAFRRRIFADDDRVTPAKLFPRELMYYYQDDYYGDVLEQAGLAHALVRDASAVHVAGASHDLLKNPNAATRRPLPIYLRLRAQLRGEPPPAAPSLWNRFVARLRSA